MQKSQSDIELAISASSTLERLLMNRFGATGKGLHEKISSVISQFDESLTKQMRFVATMRNKVVHEGIELTDEERVQINTILKRVESKFPHSVAELASGVKTFKSSDHGDSDIQNREKSNPSRKLAQKPHSYPFEGEIWILGAGAFLGLLTLSLCFEFLFGLTSGSAMVAALITLGFFALLSCRFKSLPFFTSICLIVLFAIVFLVTILNVCSWILSFLG